MPKTNTSQLINKFPGIKYFGVDPTDIAKYLLVDHSPYSNVCWPVRCGVSIEYYIFVVITMVSSYL